MASMRPTAAENAASDGHSWSESFAFAGRALACPRRFGAILPSGYELGRIMARMARGRTLVELGPGSGSITRHVLRTLPVDGQVLALELDPSIAYLLGKNLPDPRLQIRIGDAGDLGHWLGALGWERPQAILSGLPLRNFSREDRVRILSAVRDGLAPGGRFVAFQYGLRLLPEFQSVFRRVRVLGPVLRNLPPAQVLVACP